MLGAWKRLAADMLDMAGDTYSNHGCNDWKWPKGWSLEERRALVVALHEDNLKKPFDKFTANEREDAENEIAGAYGPGDFRLMRFFANQLRKPT